MSRKRSSENYYTILGVEADATHDEIRKAYLRHARECHPDKNSDPDAKIRFQRLQKVYATLSSAEKRAAYDTFGESVDDEGGRPGLTEEDILCFAKEYLGSEVEKEDLIHNVKRSKGKMENVFAFQILSEPKLDGHRFVEIIDAAIQEGTLRSYKAYETWREQVLQKPKPRVSFEARLRRKKRSNTNDDSLALIEKIQSRGAKHREMVDALQRKFVGAGSPMYDSISEEAFQATQKKILDEAAKRNAKRFGKKHKVTRGVQKRRG